MVCLNDDSPALRLADNNDRIEVLLAHYEASIGDVMAVVAERAARDLEDSDVD